MKTPPLLLGLTLVFWGWQTGYEAAGALMAVVLESAWLVKGRWEFSDEDFSRIWTFCSVLFLVAVVCAFTVNQGPAHLMGFFEKPGPVTQTSASRVGAQTVFALFRWLPMIFFLFVAAQAYSARQEIPLATFSLILRQRWRRAQKLGTPSPLGRGINASFPYFALCLFSASNHPAGHREFFWGFCLLLAWGLWSRRSPRFGVAFWLGAFALGMALGYGGQRGFGLLQSYLSSFNPQWPFRLTRAEFDPRESKTSLGQVGRLKDSAQIVIRLQPLSGGAPAYLREASYRIFRSSAWLAGLAKNNAQAVPETPRNSGHWWLVPGKTNTEKVSIACYLNGRTDEGLRTGLLPLPTGSGLLQNSQFYVLRMNDLGAVRAEGPGLVIFEADYGPGATDDTPPDFDDREDLDVPREERPALDQIISKLHLRGMDLKSQLKTIQAFFQNHFHYSLRQKRPRIRTVGETPLSRFLMRTHTGHCEYFATATVLLLRELQIPARYAVGYAVHERSGQGYVVRDRDAHAWCLLWNRRSRTWQDFDTTPASWIKMEAEHTSPLQWLSDAWSWVVFQFAKFRWGQSSLRPYLLVTLVPALMVLLYQVFFRRRGRLRQRHRTAEVPVRRLGLDSEFFVVERKLAESGAARQPNETLSDWLDRAIRQGSLAHLRQPLHELLRLHYRCRFDPRGLTSEEREQLKGKVRRVLDALGRKS